MKQEKPNDKIYLLNYDHCIWNHALMYQREITLIPHKHSFQTFKQIVHHEKLLRKEINIFFFICKYVKSTTNCENVMYTCKHTIGGNTIA